jgi:hypothetical protein
VIRPPGGGLIRGKCNEKRHDSSRACRGSAKKMRREPRCASTRRCALAAPLPRALMLTTPQRCGTRHFFSRRHLDA